jgi:para-nitrobenzyl esterase
LLKSAFAALAVAAVCAAAFCAYAAPPLVTVDGGQLKGMDDGPLNVFKGVPYAAAPVGPLRWEPPAPVPAWTGARDASRDGAICPQPTRPDGRRAAGSSQNQSEDCLFLNIWAPKNATKAPVMVWIHGGAFRFGSGEGPIYNGAAFAQDGVILVSINYRLGALGWFAHPALTHAAGPNAPLGNYGEMDQIAALKWVQRNIAAFGGDPANVTVFGESAGGASVLAILSTPSAAGSFAKAIVESGGGWGAEHDLAHAEQEGVALATAAGLPANATVGQLRALPIDKLFALPMTLGGVGPITDGRLMPASITQTFAAGHETHVPLIIGSNSFEASLMQAFKIPPQQMLARTPPAIRALYPKDDVSAADELFTDFIMGAPAHWIASQNAAAAPTFLYHFSYVPNVTRGQTPGTIHGGEIPFVFATWDRIGGAMVTPEDKAMEAEAHACWVGFAKTGAPVCPHLAWPPFDPASDITEELGEASGPRPHLRQAQYDALQKVMLPALEAIH